MFLIRPVPSLMTLEGHELTSFLIILLVALRTVETSIADYLMLLAFPVMV